MIYEQFEKEYRGLVYPGRIPGIFKESTEERIARVEKIREYNRKVNEITEKFKLALFKEHGVESNPKAEKVWSLAWEHGHSSGYSEIEIYFEEFVELIK